MLANKITGHHSPEVTFREQLFHHKKWHYSRTTPVEMTPLLAHSLQEDLIVHCYYIAASQEMVLLMHKDSPEIT